MARPDLAEPVTGTGDRGGKPTSGPCTKWYHYLGLRLRLQQGELPLGLDSDQEGREVGGR